MEPSFQWTAKTKVEFLKKLPSEARLAEALGFKPEKFLVIYDKRLRKIEAVDKWLREFPLHYQVTAGERLKELADFPGHMKKILRLASPFSNRGLCVLALGGGSIGDFAGFLASTLKRGVPLVHIPTTLLAAMDSAHGGKTALNLGDVKNQIGTFYPAESVLIVRSLFEGLPQRQLQSAAGELAKMALLSGGDLFQRFQTQFKLDLEALWELLPASIEAKYAVVQTDPLERSGERQILNLGHSLGHALESYCGLPHGIAVGEGLIFALQWSEHQGYLRGSRELVDLLVEKCAFQRPKEFAKSHKPMSRKRLSRYIAEDKKLTDTRTLKFVFLEEPGKAFRKNVTLEQFLTESQRQGWTAV